VVVKTVVSPQKTRRAGIHKGLEQTVYIRHDFFTPPYIYKECVELTATSVLGLFLG
jgi:hypothetical protein